MKKTNNKIRKTQIIFPEITKEEIAALLSYANHEFKNPLTSIKAYLQMAKRQAGKGDPISADLLESADRQVNLLNNRIRIWAEGMRSYYGINKIVLKQIEYGEFLKKMAEDSNKIGEKVFLESILPAQIWGDDIRLREAFTILLVFYGKNINASQKIDSTIEKGSVITTIDISQVKSKIIPDFKTPFIIDGEGNVKLEEDNLKLFLAWSIIRAHKGKMKITSKKNGSTISISLPLIK